MAPLPAIGSIHALLQWSGQVDCACYFRCCCYCCCCDQAVACSQSSVGGMNVNVPGSQRGVMCGASRLVRHAVQSCWYNHHVLELVRSSSCERHRRHLVFCLSHVLPGSSQGISIGGHPCCGAASTAQQLGQLHDPGMLGWRMGCPQPWATCVLLSSLSGLSANGVGCSMRH